MSNYIVLSTQQYSVHSTQQYSVHCSTESDVDILTVSSIILLMPVCRIFNREAGRKAVVNEVGPGYCRLSTIRSV